MSLPGNVLSTIQKVSAFQVPVDRDRGLLEDWEQGGTALNDPSDGLLVQAWHLTYSDPNFTVTPELIGSPSVIHSAAGCTEVALAFDANMDPTLCYTQAGQLKLWWFDVQQEAKVVTDLEATARTGRMSLDDKRPLQVQLGFPDIILSYFDGDVLTHRRQRDRYTIRYDLITILTDKTLHKVGMNTVNRFQFSYITESILPELPTVTSPTSADITETTATLGGNVTDDGGNPITERGTVWGLFANPDIISEVTNKTVVAGTTGVFTGPVTGLPNGTLIHFRAYATTSEGTAYSFDSTFTTIVDALVYDTFTDVNGTDITVHVPDIDTVGGGWQTASSLEILNNKLIAVSSFGPHSVVIDSGVAGTTVEADIIMDNDNVNGAGLWIRHNNSTHGYLISVAQSQDANPILKILEWSGSFVEKASVILTGEGPLSSISLTIKAVDTGSNIGAEVVVGGNTYNTNFNTTTFNTDTFVGIRAISASVDSLTDNFKVDAT